MAMQLLATIILDVLVAALLLTTILFCWKLNRRILVLQDSKGDMAQLIRQFDEATDKAATSVAELQGASKRLQDDMNTKIQKANFIADDLAFMIEKGNKVAEKMLSSAVQQTGGNNSATAKGAGSARVSAAASPAAAAVNASVDDAARTAQPAPRGPRLGGNLNVEGNAPAGRPAAGANPSSTTGKAALESVMERLGAKPEQPAPQSGARTANVRSRSRTEQELLDALKNDV